MRRCRLNPQHPDQNSTPGDTENTVRLHATSGVISATTRQRCASGSPPKQAHRPPPPKRARPTEWLRSKALRAGSSALACVMNACAPSTPQRAPPDVPLTSTRGTKRGGTSQRSRTGFRNTVSGKRLIASERRLRSSGQAVCPFNPRPSLRAGGGADPERTSDTESGEGWQPRGSW